MTSLATCVLAHTFPWPYANLSWTSNAHLACPSCGTDLNAIWGLASVYTSKYAYKQRA